jgi:hypothetical protein
MLLIWMLSQTDYKSQTYRIPTLIKLDNLLALNIPFDEENHLINTKITKAQ